MGQVCQRLIFELPYRALSVLEEELSLSRPYMDASSNFIDLYELPPELGLTILSYLNPTDLCLASCVWDQLANVDFLWQSLCRTHWGCVSVYGRMSSVPHLTYKALFMILDDASLTFNSEPTLAINTLIEKGILDSDHTEVAKFIHTSNRLRPSKKREFLELRPDILHIVVHLQNFRNQFLPNALRKFFSKISAPESKEDYLSIMIDCFSQEFCTCNPKLGFDKDTVFLLCYSLIMLSVDLSSPHIKNKMSKREFIKNTCRATQGVDSDFAGHLYDNVYLIGHVAASSQV